VSRGKPSVFTVARKAVKAMTISQVLTLDDADGKRKLNLTRIDRFDRLQFEDDDCDLTRCDCSQ